jgi:hypothetical protein
MTLAMPRQLRMAAGEWVYYVLNCAVGRAAVIENSGIGL